MKKIVIALIMLDFLAVIFLPNVYLSRLTLIPMFAFMVILVVLYWFTMFWVSRKDVVKVTQEEPEYDFYVGRIPSDTTADLTRGRLVKLGDRLVLFQRTEDKVHRQSPCKEVWSVNIPEITSVGFGKVLPARKGFRLYFNDDEVSFTAARLAKPQNRHLLYDALGWKMPDTPENK